MEIGLKIKVTGYQVPVTKFRLPSSVLIQNYFIVVIQSMTTTIPVTPTMSIGGGDLGGGYGNGYGNGYGHHGYGHHGYYDGDDIGHYAQHLSSQITDNGYRGVDATYRSSALSSNQHEGLLAKLNDADHRSTSTTNQGVKEILQNNCMNTDNILANSNMNNIQSIQLEDAHHAAILASQYRGYTDNLAATNATTASVLVGLGTVSDRLQSSAARDSISTQKNIVDSTVFLAKGQSDSLVATLASSERNAISLERVKGDITSSMERTAGETRGLIKDANNANLIGIKDTLLSICQSKAELGRQASDLSSIAQRQSSDNFGFLSRQIAESTSAIQLDAVKNTSSVLIDAAKNNAAIQLEAFKNTQLLASKLSDCCCEIKERIGSSAQVTQQLISNIDTNRIRDLLSASSMENTFLKYGRR